VYVANTRKHVRIPRASDRDDQQALVGRRLANLIDAANKVCDAGFCKATALMIMKEKKRLPLLWQALAFIRAILVG
jgi:hypothetical protein